MAMGSASQVFEDALEFPRSDDDWLVTVLIGGLIMVGYYFLSLISGLLIITYPLVIIPLFLVQGYHVAVIRETLAGADLPEWGDVGWGNILVDGVKLWGVGLVYSLVLLVPLFVLGLGIGLLGSAAGSESGANALAGIGSLLLFALIFIGGLVLSYVFPAAAVNFVREDSFSAAFDVGTITDVVTSGDYLVGWLLVVALGILAGLVSMVVSITIIGILVVPWISFFFSIAVFHIYARAYAGGLDLDIPLADVEAMD